MAEEQATDSATQSLGLERWVQFAFIGGALIAFWLLDHIVEGVWNLFAEPNPTVITGVSAISAVVLAGGLYRRAAVRRGAEEVAVELSKVTWPSRKETWSATVVVLVTSLIAAVILGVFDAAWSAVTDLIYNV